MLAMDGIADASDLHPYGYCKWTDTACARRTVGRQTWLVVRGFQLRVLLLDLHLPGMNGYAIARSLRVWLDPRRHDQRCLDPGQPLGS